MLKKISIVLVILVIAFTAKMLMSGNDSQKMTYENKGSIQTNLSPCKSKSNCYEGSVVYSKSVAEIKVIVLKNDQNTIRSNEGNYLYFVNQSSIFGFVDDVEFLIDHKLKKLHYRSSSRVGKSDIGANKKRIDGILAKLKL